MNTPEQIIRMLREAEQMLGEGNTVPEAAKELGISEQTVHRWRDQYGGMKADDAKRLKELEREKFGRARRTRAVGRAADRGVRYLDEYVAHELGALLGDLPRGGLARA